jgi:hypothetical protein
MALKGVYISDLDPLASLLQLPGGLFEVDVLAGPVANAYVTRRLTVEQLADHLGANDFDPYEVSLAIRQAVVDAFVAQDNAGNTSPFLDDPQPTGSLVGMEFIDPQYEYVYTYRPVGFANGTFNVWCSALLSR